MWIWDWDLGRGGLPQGYEGESEAQQQPFICLRDREGFLAQGGCERDVCGLGAFDFAEAGEVGDVFD